ncbi:MAG TPA: serine protease, partial [Polyangiaceae bacterium]
MIFAGGALAGILWAPHSDRLPSLPVPRAEAHEAIARPSSTSGRDIATRALASTVFLHGGSVYGAGVLVDRAGHVLTCDHVIDGLDHVEASFDEDAPMPVRVVARAKDVDLALLAIDHVPEGRAPLALGKVASLAMGDTVYAMGAPRKMRFSLSHGIVSYVSRSFDGTKYVQTDLAANGGSSGGPVMNERGELVGVSSFVLR